MLISVSMWRVRGCSSQYKTRGGDSGRMMLCRWSKDARSSDFSIERQRFIRLAMLDRITPRFPSLRHTHAASPAHVAADIRNRAAHWS
ncbi:hypothetical protein [Xylella fastidiosa]|uniref:hypothetical protein n=1 Tax=Xylella fastidiosa TaxID=2371 RepID=UPI002689A58C|nr:hypothetical protein [Xylella fastidiosa]